MKKLQIIISFLIFCTILSCQKNNEVDGKTQDEDLFLCGADVSFLPEVRSSGIVLYSNDHKQEDMLVTLNKTGWNLIRLRLWNNPSSSTCSFASVKSLNNEVKSNGMKSLICVHYSDSWADPGQQTKPSNWKTLNFEQLKDSVYNFTKKIIIEMNPDYIQIGNEINNGLLWPDGSFSNIEQMKSLLKEGIRAVRENSQKTKIILHYAGTSNSINFFNKMLDLDYDIIGISYYPNWHGKDLNELKQSLLSLSSIFNKYILILETAYPFTFQWNDWTQNIFGNDTQILPEFSATPQGQKEFLVRLKEIIKQVPKGLGYCYWGGEWISYKGNSATNGSPWENLAFWDYDNHALPILEINR